VATTMIDVLDSAIKIGLGAVVGFVASFLTAMQKNKHDREAALIAADFRRTEELRANQRRLAESAFVLADIFFRAHEDFILEAFSAGKVLSDHREKGSTFPIEWQEKYLSEIREKGDGPYVDAYNTALQQISMLKMASAREPAQMLSDLCDDAIAFRNEYFPLKQDWIPDGEAVRGARVEFSTARTKFEDAMSTYYTNL
jgi:hypothetical protein